MNRWFLPLMTISCLVAAGQERLWLSAHPLMFRAGFDFPVGIPHGTWDFDEWPGVDHPVVYKSDFIYNRTSDERIKIEYFLSSFDEDDHEGYLKTPEELLQRGFIDLSTLIKQSGGTKKTVVGVFAHPDDEVLLAGGFLAFASTNDWNARVLLVSNGADGSMGASELPCDQLGGYNCFGIMLDGGIKVVTDSAALHKLDVIGKYSGKLGTEINVLEVDFEYDGRKIVQIGEYPGLDFDISFEKSGLAASALASGIREFLLDSAPDIVLTHGTDGEYGNMLHRIVRTITYGILKSMPADKRPLLFTCFPEYNYHDNITHFLDLDADGGTAREMKWEAFRAITFLHSVGADYDKPWDPSEPLMNGVFVKDYGYTPLLGEPPRYEFFQFLPADTDR